MKYYYRIKKTYTKGGKNWYLPQRKLKFNLLDPKSWFWENIKSEVLDHRKLGFSNYNVAEKQIRGTKFLDDAYEKIDLNETPTKTSIIYFND